MLQLFDLLEEKDFDQISPTTSQTEQNVNRGTIYFHYADKFDLLDKNHRRSTGRPSGCMLSDSLGFYGKRT